jgi:pSer/pThr/pTyr-binding forkhead associated (FHA) protein
MLVCEKCSTRNPDASQFCDSCGAPLWLAGHSTGHLDNGNGNGSGSNGNSRQSSPRLATSGAHLSAEHVSLSNFQPAQVHATLVIERGVSAGKKFSLSSSESNIGRWDADGGVFPDVDLDSDDPEAKVSRRHARIVKRDGNYVIEDLGSTNGTFVNRGRRLAPGDRQPLKDGDEIIVGKTFLRFRVAK